MKEVILYRGPLERARLKLLINSILLNNNSKVEFVWVFPNKLSSEREEHFYNFIHSFKLDNVHLINDSLVKYFSTINKIKKLYLKDKLAKAHFIGFSSWVFCHSLNSTFKIWYVNGVPEEGLMHAKKITSKIKTYFQWKINNFFKQPDKIVTVSKPMTALVKRYVFKGAEYIEIPITVDTKLFYNAKTQSDKKYLVYLGTGAPWQALDILKEIWGSLYQIDKTLKFRVISRDERTKVLSERIPPDAIEFVGSNNFADVANWLSEARMGFLIRKDDIVNKVAFPTKFAEYAASGSLIALSELDWDLTFYLRKFNTGVLIPVDDDTNLVARKIYEYLQSTKNTSYLSRLKDVSFTLSNEYWTPVLSKHLNSIN